MTIEGRATGWLSRRLHLQARELLVHTAARHAFACPLYCLMPDHLHLLWLGVGEECDQLNAAKFFRRHFNTLLTPMGVRLQIQAYDHVLVESDRNPDAFADTCLYIANNPQRAGLVDDWRDWECLGSVVAGYPDLDPRDLSAFWPAFWTIHNRETARRAS
jgi:putative transposase